MDGDRGDLAEIVQKKTQHIMIFLPRSQINLWGRKITSVTHHVNECDIEEHSGGDCKDPFVGPVCFRESHSDEETSECGEGGNGIQQQNATHADP